MSRSLYWRLAGFYFFYFAYIGAFAPYFSLYLDALGYGAALIGLLLALPQAMRIVAAHLWAYLADRYRSRVRVTCLAGLVGTITFAGVFAGTQVAWLALCLALWSFFWSAALPLMETTTLDHLAGRSGYYGRIRLWGSIGFIVAVIGVGWLLDRSPIVVLLWILGATMVGILISTWTVPEPGLHEEEKHAAEPIRNVLRRADVIALIAACFMMAVAHGPYYTFFSLHLVAHGYSKTAIGWLWGVGVIAEIAVFAALPWLYRSFSAQRLLAASFVLAVLRFVLIAWFADVALVLFFAQLLHAATFGVFHSAALARVQEFFRGPNASRGQAVYSSLSFGLGGTLGGLGSGVAWERVGAGWTFSAAALCALLGLVLLAAVRPRRG
ncbi:MAG: MFS transporter [Betaproteobacteria bacterium]|nr:MFS transporter [Betaproteobacteria bacterium]